jgi:hypothetical protein
MFNKSVLTSLVLCSLVPFALAQEAELEAAGGQSGIGATMGIGAVTMDGKTWTQIALRPEIPIGKLGIALDLTLYFDENGDIRKEDWNDVEDILEKIYYIRWGHKGDPLYLKAGALDRVTMGYGILVHNYSNTIEYPNVRRVGFEFDVNTKLPQFEGFVANLGELDDKIGLLGVRASYPVIGNLRIGGSIVMDGNLYAGIKDQDNDGVPDPFDRYTDFNDGTEWDLWHDLQGELSPELWESMRGSASYPGDDWLNNGVKDFSDAEESVTAMGFDIGYKWPLAIETYFQWGKFQDFGSGWAPGIRWQPKHWLSVGAEYRVWDKQFIGEFFDRSYDIERVYLAGDTLYTKEERLESAVAMNGYYAEASANLFNMVNLFAAYNTMSPTDDDDAEKWNSLWASARLNLKVVPKLSELSAYYRQTGVKSLFNLKSESTIHGLKLGYNLSPGVVLTMNWRTSYLLDGYKDNGNPIFEPVRTFAIETVFRLR